MSLNQTSPKVLVTFFSLSFFNDLILIVIQASAPFLLQSVKISNLYLAISLTSVCALVISNTLIFTINTFNVILLRSIFSLLSIALMNIFPSVDVVVIIACCLEVFGFYVGSFLFTALSRRFQRRATVSVAIGSALSLIVGAGVSVLLALNQNQDVAAKTSPVPFERYFLALLLVPLGIVGLSFLLIRNNRKFRSREKGSFSDKDDAEKRGIRETDIEKLEPSVTVFSTSNSVYKGEGASFVGSLKAYDGESANEEGEEPSQSRTRMSSFISEGLDAEKQHGVSFWKFYKTLLIAMVVNFVSIIFLLCVMVSYEEVECKKFGLSSQKAVYPILYLSYTAGNLCVRVVAMFVKMKIEWIFPINSIVLLAAATLLRFYGKDWSLTGVTILVIIMLLGVSDGWFFTLLFGKKDKGGKRRRNKLLWYYMAVHSGGLSASLLSSFWLENAYKNM